MNEHLQRAVMLMGQDRYDLAEESARRALMQEPDSAIARSLLANCFMHTDRLKEATMMAQEAIGLAPESAYAHFILSLVYMRRKRLDKAEQSIREAISLDPEDATYYGVLAAILLDRDEKEEALRMADTGLALDPEDEQCANIRAMALTSLGRGKEAIETAKQTLQRNPESADSHESLGWQYLRMRDPKSALLHFQEALRIEPSSESAKSGLVESLKARYFLYRILLGYFFWMLSLGSQARWGVILGGWFGSKLLKGMAKANPNLEVLVVPILIVYGLFVLSTWFGMPIANSLLRLNRYGKYALTHDQRMQSNWVIGLFIAAIVTCLAIGFTMGWETSYFSLCIVALVIPVSSIFECAKGWPRMVMMLLAGLLGAMVVFVLLMIFVEHFAGGAVVAPFIPLLKSMTFILPFGLLASLILANVLSSVTVKE